MRRPQVLIILAALITSIAGTTFASLFVWRDRVRPPVSLREALDISEKILGEDLKNRYCVNVSLYGNPTGAPKPGAWNLLFAAADGSKKHVYVDMDRNSKISIWNESTDWTKDAGRRKSLDDVKSRLEMLFVKENLDVAFERKDERLIGRFRTRAYEIYKIEQDGSFSDNLTTEIGPQGDGFTFEAEIVNEGAEYSHFQYGPYWTESNQLYPMTEKGKLLLVRKRYGRDFKKELHSQIDQAFGIDFVNP